MKFRSKKPHYEYLHKKWTAKSHQATQNILEKHFHRAAAASLGGLMLLTTPAMPVAKHTVDQTNNVRLVGATNKNVLMAAELTDKLPQEVRPLDTNEEVEIAKILEKNTGIKVSAEVDNKRLNRSYGLIGAEQHLYRYPGDTVESHARNMTDWAMYGKSGIAPGLGAWGYFAPSKAEFSAEDEERERWYVVAQTFLSPGFSERVGEYRDFYKYRKILVVNPKTGQAVVGDIADAGPGQSTGKHYGGSPEVMHELGYGTGPRKGPVLFYFIDDPDNKIPLGPLKMPEQQLAKL